MTEPSTPVLNRRVFLGTAATASVAAALAQKGWLDAAAFISDEGVDVDGLKSSGYDIRHTICHGCGAACGLTALINKNARTPDGQPDFVLFGNEHPDHPQPGICGRGASSVSTWNSPLRLKKPMKRTGERGSGDFEEISWDQALEEISVKLKKIIERDGPESFAVSRHEFKTEGSWLTTALNTPNLIGQATTCNTEGTIARKWMMGGAFSHHAKVDPDYDNCRFVLFPGRQMAAPVAVQTRVGRAKQLGAEIAFLNPAQPDAAMGSAEWIPIKPGTDAAFMLGLANVLVNEQTFDEAFVTQYTNLPYLIKADGKPLVGADLEADGGSEDFKVFDGESVVSAAAISGAPQLAYEGEVTLADGTTVPVRSAWLMFLDHIASYSPVAVSNITGVPESTIIRMARKLWVRQGVIEDTWYNTRNGNDLDAVAASLAVNGLIGNFDKPGGMCFKPGNGLSGGAPKVADDGTITTPLGDELKLPKTGKSIDKQMFPETNGCFEAVVRSVLGEDDAPYKIKALLVTDGTLFHRDNGTRRIEKMLETLELFVMTDIVHQEACDWADYVLPADMFVERDHLNSMKWCLQPSVALAKQLTTPPPGAEARHLMWIFMNLINRMYPERATALGFRPEFKDPDVFRDEFLHRMERVRLEKLARHWNRDADELQHQLERDGFANFGDIEYGQIPYKKPFDSPSGKLEVFMFYPVLKGFRESGLPSYFEAPAYSKTKGGREFIFVSGKQPATSSGVASLAFTATQLADNRVWINPADARRLQISTGDRVQLEGMDTGWKAEAEMRVTSRIVEGSLFTFSYVGGNRHRILKETRGFERLTQGVNSQWFTARPNSPIHGSNANNAAVRITRKIA